MSWSDIASSTAVCTDDPLRLEMMKTYVMGKGVGTLDQVEWRTLVQLLLDTAARDYFIKTASPHTRGSLEYSLHRWAGAGLVLAGLEPEFAGSQDRAAALTAMSGFYNACVASNMRDWFRSAGRHRGPVIHESGMRERLKSLHLGCRSLRLLSGRIPHRRWTAASVRRGLSHVDSLLLTRHWFSPCRALLTWFAENHVRDANETFWAVINDYGSPLYALEQQLDAGGLSGMRAR